MCGSGDVLSANKKALVPEIVKQGITSVDSDKQGVERSVRDAHKSGQTWASARLDNVSTLQVAERNHGYVSLMKSLDNGGRMVAVKCMPNAWVCKSQDEFGRRYPLVSERPWYDIGLPRYLYEHGYPYVCEPLGLYHDSELTYVVSAYASRGDLFKWCERSSGPNANCELIARPLAVQIFDAVRLLHDMGIAHGDLSLENVVLTDGQGGAPCVKLIDFGMASRTRRSTRMRGKPSYMAPEMHWEIEYDTFLADVFSLGTMLFALVNKEYPWSITTAQCHHFDYFQEHGLMDYLSRRRRLQRPRFWIDAMSSDLLHLLSGLLAVDPQDRWTLGERCWENDLLKDGADSRRTSAWESAWLQRCGHEPRRQALSCPAVGGA